MTTSKALVTTSSFTTADGQSIVTVPMYDTLGAESPWPRSDSPRPPHAPPDVAEVVDTKTLRKVLFLVTFLLLLVRHLLLVAMHLFLVAYCSY